MLELYVIRHGRTRMNKQGLLQGRGTNLPLDEEGRAQAQAATDWVREHGIHFDRVISSPLARARETASIVAGVGEDAIETDDRLLEMDYGPWEGYDLSRHDPAIDSWFADFEHAPAPEGIESLAHVTARATEFLKTLGADDGRVLVSTHAILLKGILESLDPSARGAWWSRYVGNCWIYRSVASAAGEGPAGLGVAELAYDAGRKPAPGV